MKSQTGTNNGMFHEWYLFIDQKSPYWKCCVGRCTDMVQNYLPDWRL